MVNVSYKINGNIENIIAERSDFRILIGRTGLAIRLRTGFTGRVGLTGLRTTGAKKYGVGVPAWGGPARSKGIAVIVVRGDGAAEFISRNDF